jgi:hypothetical protein
MMDETDRPNETYGAELETPHVVTYILNLERRAVLILEFYLLAPVFWPSGHVHNFYIFGLQ